MRQPLEHPAITHYQHIFSWQVELGYNKHYSKHDKLSFSLACLLVCFIFNQIWKPGFSELFKKLDMVSLARCRPTGIARVSLLFWIPSVPLICTLLLSLLHAASYPLYTTWPWSFPRPPSLLLSLHQIIPFLWHLWSHSLLIFLLLLCSLSVSFTEPLTLECFRGQF